MKASKILLCFILSLLCAGLCCCNNSNSNNSLTKDYKASSSVPVYDFYDENLTLPENYDIFAQAYCDFAAALLSSSTEDENTVISPLSLYSALAMTANGSAGKTLSKLENLLGESIDSENINLCIHYLSSRLKAFNKEDSYLIQASSLWFDDDYSVKSQFLQSCVNYYDSEIFRTSFDNDNVIEEVNSWISERTDGKLNEIISQLDESCVSLIISTTVFSDLWLSEYTSENTSSGTFYGENSDVTATFLQSNEMMIQDENAKGFVKSFKTTPCKFVALLPDEDIDIDTYISTLTGTKISELMQTLNPSVRCDAYLAEFDASSSLSFKTALSNMGLSDIFEKDKANFSNLSMSDSMYISDILQKTFVTISPKGACAGSATVVEASDSVSSDGWERLVFDRPFIFMIIDNEKNLPLFMGVIKDLS